MVKDLDLCHLNLATTTIAYNSCTKEVAPALGFWQKPVGLIVIGVLSAGVGAFAYGYIKAN